MQSGAYETSPNMGGSELREGWGHTEVPTAPKDFGTDARVDPKDPGPIGTVHVREDGWWVFAWTTWIGALVLGWVLASQVT